MHEGDAVCSRHHLLFGMCSFPLLGVWLYLHFDPSEAELNKWRACECKVGQGMSVNDLAGSQKAVDVVHDEMM